MPTLPNVSDVTGLVDAGLTDAQVEARISDAALLAGACVSTLDCDLQRAIIKYVAAHLIALANPVAAAAVTSRKLGDASETFAVAAAGDGLAGTQFGRAAIQLDPNGCLLRLGQRRAYLKVI